MVEVTNAVDPVVVHAVKLPVFVPVISLMDVN